MLTVLAPAVFIALFINLFERGGSVGIREAFLRSVIALSLFVVFSTEALSIAGLIGPAGIGIAWIGLLGFLLFRERGRLKGIAGDVAARFAGGLKSVPSVPLAAAFVILLITLVIALVSPPNTYDSQTYHMARIMHWIQNGSVAHYPTVILRQLYQPPFAEFAIMHLQILSGGDRFANLVQWFAMPACAAGVSLIAAETGMSQRFQAIAGSLAVMLPGAIVQASSTQNDLVAALFVIGFLLAFLRALRSGAAADFLWAGIALGLALLTKGTMYPFCFPIGAFFAVVGFLNLRSKPERLAFVRRVGILLAIALAINFGHFARNTLLFGAPLTTADDDVRNKHITVKMAAANIARNYAMNLGTRSATLRSALEGGMRSVFGDELKNKDSTWLDNEFKIEYSAHEDLTGNFVHVLLITIALAALAFMARKSVPMPIWAIAFTIILGFGIFSALLKWQIWSARLQLPLFMLGTVLATYVLSRIAPRFAPTAIVTICFLAAVPFLLFADPRRVFSNNGQFVLFGETRQQKLFKNLADAGPLYAKAAEVIRSRDQESVGIAIEYNDYDYPLWTLLKDDPRNRPRLVHSGVENVSKKLIGNRPPPPLIFTTRSDNRFEGIDYREVWKNDVIRVLERVDP